MSEIRETQREYTAPQLKLYGTIEQLTQKTLSEPSDGNYLDPGQFPLNGSCICIE